ncbi:MAG: N-methyl-L-tryptophan oxidase [Thermodesulfobacteriota bacterium]|nr:N-methyl-L-tryptophan oxidase [Thermodesulfobacteriota bacterium]
MGLIYDFIVVGLGAHGSSTLYQLSKTGKKVLGIDSFSIGHNNGSSHGESRMIRFSYSNGEHYVPMLLRSKEIWKEIENESKESLLFQKGALFAGEEDHPTLIDAKESADKHNLEYDILSSTEVRKLYPQFVIGKNSIGFLDKTAGYLLSESCIRTFINLADRNGAEILLDTPVTSIEPMDDKVIIQANNQRYEAEKVILTVGAYINELCPDFSKYLSLWRLVAGWFEPDDISRYGPEDFPSFVLIEKDHYSYGFPTIKIPGVKIGFSMSKAQNLNSTGEINREINDDDIESLRYWLEKYLPGVNGNIVQVGTCFGMSTPDRNFILGPHPKYPNIILGHACSGHGFKMSSAIGEILADLSQDRQIKFDLSPHSPKRFFK